MVLYDLNPGSGANTSNLIQIARGICCDQEGNICQYVLNLTSLGTVTSIAVKDRNGTVITTSVTGVTDKVTLREAIVQALAAAGGRVHSGGIKITEDSGSYSISVMGEVEIVNLNNGSTRTFAKNCTQAWQCINTFIVKSGADGENNLTVGSSTESLGAIDYPTTTAIDIRDIITAMDGVDIDNTTVTVDAVLRAYVINVAVDSKTAVFLNGNPAIDTSCMPVFTT